MPTPVASLVCSKLVVVVALYLVLLFLCITVRCALLQVEGFKTTFSIYTYILFFPITTERKERV